MMNTQFKSIGSSTTTSINNRKRKEIRIKQGSLIVEVLEVSWEGGIASARAKTAIAAPHWKKGAQFNEENFPSRQRYSSGSTMPGAYLIKSKNLSEKLSVKIKITRSEGHRENGKLVGSFDKLKFEGSCPTSIGEHEVTLKITNLPNHLAHFEGDASWQIETSSMSVKIPEKTRLEMFVLLDKPAKFFLEGAWAEALRFVFKKANVGGMTDSAQAAKNITHYCHTKHGMRYDTFSGGGKFGGSGIAETPFSLLEYITWSEFPLSKKNIYGDMKNNVVNCYDQAAAVQSLCGVLGIRTEWVFAYPYGYIKTADLVGVGLCNNPFFKNAAASPELIVPPGGIGRQPFGNHAYLQLNNKIGNVLDACAGPHTGTEDMSAYLNNAIDAAASVKEPSFVTAIQNQTGSPPLNASEYLSLLTTVLRRPGQIPSVK